MDFQSANVLFLKNTLICNRLQCLVLMITCNMLTQKYCFASANDLTASLK